VISNTSSVPGMLKFYYEVPTASASPGVEMSIMQAKP
jgi:hypothetical protein